MKELLFLGLAWCVGLVSSGYVPPGPKYPCPSNNFILYPCQCVKGSDTGLTVTCSNSNLASLAIAFANIVAMNDPLDYLLISHSRFTRLYGNLLYAMEIKVLEIRDTPLKKIEPLTFLGVNRTLEELHLIRTDLESFPTEAFQSLGALKVLRMEGHSMSSIPVDGFIGLLSKNLEKLSISDGNITELSPDTLAQCRKLKRLDLHGNQFSTLKKGQFKNLKSVEILDLSHNQIAKIDASQISDLNKLSTFNLSHNLITEITRGAFARNTVLRSLNLNHNKIRKIESTSFRGMRLIRRLYLSDNEITDVGRDAFGSISRIGTIDLARNKLKKIDFQMFSQLQYAELIDVSDNLVTEIQKTAFKDLYLVHINLSHNAISKIEPGAFINCANITLLDLSHNKLDDIHPRAFDETTYPNELQLSYNNLTSLSKVPLANMTGIKILNVTHNRLRSIPRNTFPKLYELHTIDLSHNLLTDIYNGVFQSLFSLRFLNLSYNSMEEIKSSTFGPLSTLLEIDLSYNQLREISRGSLARLTSLQRLKLSHNRLSKIFQVSSALGHLDLSFNEIEEIQVRTWPPMNSLLSLDLSDNFLQDSLTGGSFANLLTLQTLDLSRNYITQPPYESLTEIPSLQYLYLMENNLTSLSKGAFGKLPIVFELNLASNQISNVSIKAFDGLLQLLNLNLSMNQIEHIPNGAFHGLVSLRTLDLSHNGIESLDNKTNSLLEDCLSLEKLVLTNNRISYVTKKSFPSDPYQPYKLNEIDLSYNVMPALTYDITYGTSKVKMLNLSHNMINEIRKDVIGNLTSLESLDLSFNELKDISEKRVFTLPLTMKDLYLRGNQLESLPIKQFKGLRTLDLRNNQLDYYPLITKMVKNGTDVLYSGNSLTCDCHMRPLRRWLVDDERRFGDWSEVKCTLPRSVEGTPFLSLPEEDLSCPGDMDTENEEYNTTPDLKFRNLERSPNGKISLTWYVTAKEDIADFKLIVRDKSQTFPKPMIDKALDYNTRSAIVNKLPTQKELELCVVALDSEGKEREIHDLQCRNIIPSSASSFLVVPSNLFLSSTLIFSYFTLF